MGYRQIYAGKVKTITEDGRILMPAKEVERILGSAEIYNGRAPSPMITAGGEEVETGPAEHLAEIRRGEEASEEKG